LPFRRAASGRSSRSRDRNHPGFFELEEAGHLPAFGNVDDLVLEWSENPEEHIKEVDADVRPHAAGLLDVAFPGDVVPASAGRNVGQLDIAFCI